MPDSTSPSLSLARLRRDEHTSFEIAPGADDRAALADALGIIGIRKLRLVGRLVPEGARDWRLEAVLGATVIQECVVTTDPVTTRIDEEVHRHYAEDVTMPSEEEAEMPEDDTLEPLPAQLDLEDVMSEALALALPPFPRAPGAALGQAVFTAPGVAPMTDEEAKPLAGLAALRAQMEDDRSDDESGGESGGDNGAQ